MRLLAKYRYIAEDFFCPLVLSWKAELFIGYTITFKNKLQ